MMLMLRRRSEGGRARMRRWTGPARRTVMMRKVRCSAMTVWWRADVCVCWAGRWRRARAAAAGRRLAGKIGRMVVAKAFSNGLLWSARPNIQGG